MTPHQSDGKKPRTLRKSGRGILLTILVTVSLFFLIWSVPLPYYFREPGEPINAVRIVQVEGKEPSPDGIFITTVISNRANGVLYLYHYFRPDSRLVPVKSAGSAIVNAEALIEDPYEVQLQESTYRARLFALREMGYDLPVEFDGAQVTAHLPGSRSVDILHPGDVITAVDGERIRRQEDIHRYVNRMMDQGKTTFQVTFIHNGNETTRQIAAIRDQHRRASLGTYYQTHLRRVDMPVNITITPRGFSGSSAGLPIFLEIIRQMSEEDITHGFRIAATGTITRTGHLDPVEGVQYKVTGAIKAGSDVFICPPGNFREARRVADGRIRVITAGDLGQVLLAMKGL